MGEEMWLAEASGAYLANMHQVVVVLLGQYEDQLNKWISIHGDPYLGIGYLQK